MISFVLSFVCRLNVCLLPRELPENLENKRELSPEENSSSERKRWQFYCFSKMKGFCWRGRGRSFYVEGPNTEKARQPPVESLVQGIWRLRASEAERRVREGV